jgi:DNA-binding transcriptional regulator YiaG
MLLTSSFALIQQHRMTSLPSNDSQSLDLQIESDRTQSIVEKLRQGKSFVGLVLANVATGINQHRLSRISKTSKRNADLINLYSETEKIGALQKPVIAKLEKLFKAFLKKEEFWEEKAIWILSQLASWEKEGKIPQECSLPGVLSIAPDPTLSEGTAWRESVLMSACAFYTASDFISYLNLTSFSIEDLEKLLGIREDETPTTDHTLFQGKDIEKVATGYPILTGAQALINSQWQNDEYPYWRKLVGDGFIQHNIVRKSSETSQIELVPGKAAWEIIQQFGPEAAYILLIFSSYATDSEKPWEQVIRLKGTDLIKLFGWDRRTDITLGQKLKKIGNLAELVCSLSVLVSNINIGANRYNIARSAMWLLEEIEYSGQLALTIDNDQPKAVRYEAGEPDELYIRVRPGSWTEKFLNQRDSIGRETLRQYGYLAKSTLKINPYRERLASKLSIFLTIMSRIRQDGRYEVGTLLERLEPEDFISEIQKSKQKRNHLINQWDNALLKLHELGWQIEFDPESYPESIRPEWSLVGAEESTRSRPRNWLGIWLKALISIKPTSLIQEKLESVRATASSKKRKVTPEQTETTLSNIPDIITGKILAQALEAKGLSKAQLAKQLEVDRSMVTRWIKGERTIQPKHQEHIKQLMRFELQQLAEIS